MEVRYCPFCGSFLPPLAEAVARGVACRPCKVKVFEVRWHQAAAEDLYEDDPWDSSIWDRVRVELVKNTAAKGGA